MLAKASTADDAVQFVGSDAHRAVEQDVSVQAVAVLRDDNQSVPLKHNEPLFIVNTSLRASYEGIANTRGIGPNQSQAAYDIFAIAMQQAFNSVTLIGAEDIQAGYRFGDGTIIAVTENYPLPGMDFDKSRQLDIIQQLYAREGDRVLVAALRDPYDLFDLPEGIPYVCGFSFRPSAARAVAAILAGEVVANGKLPVTA